MADYNRNRNTSDDNWDQNKDRNYNQNDYDQSNYNNANQETDWRNMNRNKERNYNYGTTSYGNTATGKYRNTGAYGGGGYGMYSSDYNQNRRDRDSGDSYYSHQPQNRRQDWGRANVDTGMNYHNDYRRNWGDNDMGYDNQNYGSDYTEGRGYAGDYNTGYYGTYNMGYGNHDRDNNWQRRSGQRNGQNNYGNYRNINMDRNDRDWWDRTRDEVSSWFGDDDAERRRRLDHMNANNHRGKGPKDYRRSEDRIREDVCDRLTDDDMLDATNIQVQIQGDNVILSGSVNSRDQKRRAEDLAESISGVRDVENRIRVDHGDNYSSDYRTGNEAGTTNETIRNVQNERKGKNS